MKVDPQGEVQVRKNIFDLAVDLLKERHGKAKALIEERFKGTKPYRQEKISADDAITEYMNLDPRVAEQLRQTAPREFNTYEMKMQDLMKRRGHG